MAICPYNPRGLSSIKLTLHSDSNQNTRKSKSLELNFTIWEKKPTSQDQFLHAERENRRAPFLSLLGAGCTLSLSASSTGLRYYITQCLKTAPLPRKHQGILDTAPRYPFRPNTQPFNATDAEPCSLTVSSLRHLPCTCCNPISTHSWCTLHDCVWPFYLPTHQTNVLGRYPITYLLQT